MVVIPCSAKTLAAIANGYADNLITRTADVCLKEHRTVFLSQEKLLSQKSISGTCLLRRMPGRRLCQPVRGFYNNPGTIDDLVDMVVARVLDHLGVEHTLAERWGGYGA